MPIKSSTDFPRSVEDGGGLFSQPDWSQGDRIIPDSLAELRKPWLNLIIQNRLDKKLLAFCGSGSTDPPFTPEELVPFRLLLENFLHKHNQPVDWSIRAHQPMHLRILQAIGSIMKDEDITLFPSLLEGVSTGFLNDIPPSGIFPAGEGTSSNHTVFCSKKRSGLVIKTGGEDS